jgi:hypothetical protein
VALRIGQYVAATHLPAIFDSAPEDLFENYQGFVLLLLREAEREGHGTSTLQWIDSSGSGDRHWPLLAAFEAYMGGQAKLQDVNPEVRSAAQRIYSLLIAPRRYRESVEVRELEKRRLFELE